MAYIKIIVKLIYNCNILHLKKASYFESRASYFKPLFFIFILYFNQF